MRRKQSFWDAEFFERAIEGVRNQSGEALFIVTAAIREYKALRRPRSSDITLKYIWPVFILQWLSHRVNLTK